MGSSLDQRCDMMWQLAWSPSSFPRNPRGMRNYFEDWLMFHQHPTSIVDVRAVCMSIYFWWGSIYLFAGKSPPGKPESKAPSKKCATNGEVRDQWVGISLTIQMDPENVTMDILLMVQKSGKLTSRYIASLSPLFTKGLHTFQVMIAGYLPSTPAGGWTNPFETYASQIWIISPF